MYVNVSLFIDGAWSAAASGRTLTVMNPATTMGPLANPRRVTAMEGFIADAVQKGATDERGAVRPARFDGAVQDLR